MYPLIRQKNKLQLKPKPKQKLLTLLLSQQIQELFQDFLFASFFNKGDISGSYDCQQDWLERRGEGKKGRVE